LTKLNSLLSSYFSQNVHYLQAPYANTNEYGIVIENIKFSLKPENVNEIDGNPFLEKEIKRRNSVGQISIYPINENIQIDSEINNENHAYNR